MIYKCKRTFTQAQLAVGASAGEYLEMDPKLAKVLGVNKTGERKKLLFPVTRLPKGRTVRAMNLKHLARKKQSVEPVEEEKVVAGASVKIETGSVIK